MDRRLFAVAALSLALSACADSQRFAAAPDSSSLPMPAHERSQAPELGGVPAPAARDPFVASAAPRREGDPLPSAYADASATARETGERIGSTADRIIVEKAAHRMTLYKGNSVLARFRIALGDPYGKKTRQGDRRTPEGLYFIDARNEESNFHLALHVSYPNEQDKARAAAEGVSPGGAIMIHGLAPQFAHIGEQHAQTDWTVGCMAVTNQEMDYLWRAVPLGTPIEIRA